MAKFFGSKTVAGWLMIGGGMVLRARGFPDLGDAMVVTGSALVGISAKQTKDHAAGKQ